MTWPRLLQAEWTKFRSVRGWAGGIAVAALLMLLFPVVGLAGGGGDKQASAATLGPDGEPVSDSYFFVHRVLAGDGQITVEVKGLASERGTPWAKAGLIISAGPEPGARYAAVLVTAGHGVRMQHDYRYDRASSDAAARWLRLTRRADTIIGEASADGQSWSRIDTVRLPGLATTVRAGLFVTCPDRVQGIGTASDTATAEFGTPRVMGDWSPAAWAGGQVGAYGARGGFTPSANGFTVSGAGDLAPATRGDVPVAAAAGDLLLGTFLALIVVVVVATLTITTEYRYGLIRGTLSARPRRGRVLAAKATVLAGVTFAAGLGATVVALPLWLRLIRGLGIFVFPAPPGVLLRAEVGTAAVLAAVAVFALALGTVLRRSATAVTAVVATTVLPYLLALVPFLPPPMAQWLTRFTPVAGLAVQQTLIRYPQVDSVYTPADGYYPLAPWAGFAVLCGYTALALAVALIVLRRRDA
ncbi:hypothetical protein [Actinoplanes subtropicus]|uniref:hypothetical protein n=1 Tax=Actinoplanes subtropicus TaxID=543632 RepID=UPI0004C41FC5|nr:hypothetical protein [Actinoplanes subtropicus]